MRVLILHNRYVLAGGEDEDVRLQTKVLREDGHEVSVLEKDNRAIADLSPLDKIALFFNAVGHARVIGEVETAIKDFHPDVVHAHNTWPLWTPAVYGAAKGLGVPVVQTLHNFRLLCPAATFYRAGKICEDCVKHSLGRALTRRCYRGSFFQTLMLMRVLLHHRRLGTWRNEVDLYLTKSRLMRDRLVATGLVAAEKFADAPVFCEIPAAGERTAVESAEKKPFCLFGGRLTEEKGVRTLLAAWRDLPDVPLSVSGDGPLASLVTGAAAPNILHSPPLAHAEFTRRLAGAQILLLPSEWYEGFPVTLLEAMALGRPIIASKLGTPGEVLTDGQTALLTPPGDAAALAAAVRRLWENAELRLALSENVSRLYRERFAPETNRQKLYDAYRRVGVRC
jgi:glycosyltransferase involved in cell wall biosynthesis